MGGKAIHEAVKDEKQDKNYNKEETMRWNLVNSRSKIKNV